MSTARVKPQDYKKSSDIPREIDIREDGFNIHIRRSPTEYCIVEDLVINGHPAFIFDLGIITDIDPDNAPPCGCGYRAFVPKCPTEEVLEELELTKDDYARLAEVLKRNLDFGYCKRCR